MARKGKQTLVFSRQPEILSAAAVVGEKEGKGPMASYFDHILKEDTFGEKTWEQGEVKMLKEAISLALGKVNLCPSDVDVLLAGDLLNQLMSSSYMAREMGIPFLGLYGACSTMTEALLIGSMMVDGGYAETAAAAVSSHYCTAERQFRMPLEHGNQRPMSAQWTATAAGCMILSSSGREGDMLVHGNAARRPVVTHGTIGRVVDKGIRDTHQMWAAMSGAAVDTLLTHFEDTGRTPKDYDLILSGDMGIFGKKVVIDLLQKEGIDISPVYDDCGAMLFSEKQDTHGGGSGCGCSACIYASKVFQELQNGTLERVLLMSTGALLSTISCQQGESIPGIAHAVAVEGRL